MVSVGEPAPDFTVPLAGGSAYNDVSEFTLSEAIGEGPIVLAFFPAAFTSGCTDEMCTFRDSIAGFKDLDASVYGVSTDLPFAQNVFSQQHELGFPLLSDYTNKVIEKYGVVLEGMYDVMFAAERSVFVIDADGIITYAWVRDGENPDFSDLVAEVKAAVEAAR